MNKLLILLYFFYGKFSDQEPVRDCENTYNFLEKRPKAQSQSRFELAGHKGSTNP